jgi:hypothetical protein
MLFRWLGEVVVNGKMVYCLSIISFGSKTVLPNSIVWLSDRNTSKEKSMASDLHTKTSCKKETAQCVWQKDKRKLLTGGGCWAGMLFFFFEHGHALVVVTFLGLVDMQVSIIQ